MAMYFPMGFNACETQSLKFGLVFGGSSYDK